MNRDLTVGKPESVLWRFCMPLFGSIVFQQLYNIADSLVAGKFIGENALAAVGNSYEITLIFIAFAFGCNIGCSVVVSQYFGAKRYGEMKTAVHTGMIASAVTCLILMLIGIFGCDALLKLIRTPAEIFDDSSLYLDVYALGLPFVFFYNISEGIFSALGDSKTPFCFLAVSSLSNIGMDVLFVAGFHMGVAGVAWATFLCQGVSCVVALIFVFRRLRGMPSDEPSQAFSLPIFKKFAMVAIPSILQQSFISVGNIIIQGVINGFGPAVVAGYSAAVKLNNLVITSFTTLANGISNYTAQNLGAKMVWLLSIPLIALYWLGSDALIKLFVENPSRTALDTGRAFLRILSPFYLIISIKLVADGVLRGSSMMKQFMVSTFTDLTLRVALAFALSAAMGATGIWCAWPVGWSVATVLSVLFYKQGYWNRMEETSE